jgi:hypothetical protein
VRTLAVLLIVACGEPARRPAPDAAAYLAGVAGERNIEWALDLASWKRIVVEPFQGLYPDYRRELARVLPELERLRPTQTFASRAHFAGDPALTPGQARARWLLPTLFPSEVVTVDGKPLDLVFLRDGERWHAITGIDRILRARIDQRDPACGVTFDTPHPSKPCRDTAWMVADATLRNEPARIVRACAILQAACAKPSP